MVLMDRNSQANEYSFKTILRGEARSDDRSVYGGIDSLEMRGVDLLYCSVNCELASLAPCNLNWRSRDSSLTTCERQSMGPVDPSIRISNVPRTESLTILGELRMSGLSYAVPEIYSKEYHTSITGLVYGFYTRLEVEKMGPPCAFASFVPRELQFGAIGRR